MRLTVAFLILLGTVLAGVGPAVAQQAKPADAKAKTEASKHCSDKALAARVRGEWKVSAPGSEEWKQADLMPLVDAVHAAMAASRHVTINHADVYITRYVVAKKRLFQKIAFLKESSDSAGRLELKGHVVLQDARTGKVSYGCDLVTSTKFRLFELGKVEQGKFWIPKDKG
ncbi:MAG: hypothetical protein JNK11_00465 [Alphaproteobacteria bacterium]|nr:hypothetical protein [Alphaproteobacteria bacterium]